MLKKASTPTVVEILRSILFTRKLWDNYFILQAHFPTKWYTQKWSRLWRTIQWVACFSVAFIFFTRKDPLSDICIRAFVTTLGIFGSFYRGYLSLLVYWKNQYMHKWAIQKGVQKWCFWTVLETQHFILWEKRKTGLWIDNHKLSSQ